MLYDKNGRPRQPFTATNSRGQRRTRNFDVVRLSESTYECDGCGRKFSAFDLPHYSLAVEAPRLYARNKGIATAHAARCRGTAHSPDPKETP